MKKITALSITTAVALTMFQPTNVFAAPVSYNPGVTVGKNTNTSWVAEHIATFVFEDTDARDAVQVDLVGGFQFYDPATVSTYKGMGDNSHIPMYTPFEYKDGMFVAGNNEALTMTETQDERFELTLPLPDNQYYYRFDITYSDGTKVEGVQDPTNPSIKNLDSDVGWSTFYVGNGNTKGQEYIYPRTDEKKGTYSFVNYTAVDHTSQPLGIYVPYNYDSSKTYKTIYVSHGGGGNEVEWMTIGSIPNIMDNLIAKEEIAEAIVVTMDNTYFAWNYDKIALNVTDHIVPYIESHYNVSNKSADRAFCGLSMGSMTTNSLAARIPEFFDYFGSFSGGNADLNPDNYNADALKSVTYYLTAGCIDMAYNNDAGISSIDYMKLLDSLGVKYSFDLKNGAHDWFVWRDSFTTFAKDYLWDIEKTATTPDTDEAEVEKDVVADKEHEIVKTADLNQFFMAMTLCALSLGGIIYIKKSKLTD